MESLEVICCFQAASDWPGAGPDADIAVQCEMLVGSGDTIWKIRAWKKSIRTGSLSETLSKDGVLRGSGRSLMRGIKGPVTG